MPAYLTASEVVPPATKALCIAPFHAINTAVGGIGGPWLLGRLIDGDSESNGVTVLAIGYFIGSP